MRLNLKKKSNLFLIFENVDQILFFFYSKMVTTIWKTTKKTEENIWSKILLHAKKWVTFVWIQPNFMPDRMTSFFEVLWEIMPQMLLAYLCLFYLVIIYLLLHIQWHLLREQRVGKNRFVVKVVLRIILILKYQKLFAVYRSIWKEYPFLEVD